MTRLSALFYSSVLLLHLRVSTGSIIIPAPSSGTTSYSSQPAGFGTAIGSGFFVYAHLQKIDDDEYLCGGKHDLNPSDEANNYGLRHASEDSSTTSLKRDRVIKTFNSTSNNFDSKDSLLINHVGANNRIQLEKGKQPKGKPKKKSTIIDPPDELPVVLLAKRGKCQYATKARTAMAISPRVKFIIVAAITVFVPDEYIVMEAVNSNHIDVGLLYVNYDTGEALKNAIKSETPPQKKDGGIIVALNGVTLPVRFYDASQMFMVAALTVFFFFISLFGCCMMCCQSTYIYRNGSIITIGFRPEDVPQANGPAVIPLLTEEQVMRLPEIEYTGVSADTVNQPLELAATTTTEVAASNSTILRDNNEQTNTDTEIELNRQSYLVDPRHETLCSNASCSICLEEYELGEKLRLLPCNHLFHMECIQPWLTERYPNCPLCKAVVSAVDLENARTDLSNEGETADRNRGTALLRFPNWTPAWLSNRIPLEANSQITSEGNQSEGIDALQAPLIPNTQPSPDPPSRQVV